MHATPRGPAAADAGEGGHESPAGASVPRRLGRVLLPAERAFDRVDAWWERPATQRGAGVLLVLAFLLALAAAELARRGLLPAGTVPPSHFWAVDVAFTLLLVLELVALVLALARSVAASVGKQLEVLALILLRKAFLEVAHVGEPVAWAAAAAHVPGAMADMAGALAVFVLAEVFARVQRHRPIAEGDDQAAFVAAKKGVALALLVAFAAGAADAARHFALGRAGGGPLAFFEICFTVLIFSDVLLVLLSLAVSADHRVVFRNSGFAAATVMIRLALTAPRYLNVLLAAGAALYAVLVSVAYERARGAWSPRAPGARDSGAHGPGLPGAHASSEGVARGGRGGV